MNAAAGIWLLIAIGSPDHAGVDQALVFDKSYSSLAACSFDAGKLDSMKQDSRNVVCAFVPKVGD